MKKYPTIYADKSGKVKTFIINNFSEKGTLCLELIIDGVSFIGSSFDSFELAFPEKYTEQQINRFTLNKVPISGSDNFVLELCNCKLDIQIQQKVIELKKEVEIDANLSILLQLGKPSKNGGISKLNAQFKFFVNNETFTSESDSFETSLAQIQKEMLPNFKLKNCFTCHYSDYSPVGNGFFGTMMCFRHNKVD